jgi:hypothetical protein
MVGVELPPEPADDVPVNPDVTPELVALRTQQRQMLLEIPRSVIERVERPAVSGVRAPNACAELSVREEARPYGIVLEQDLARLRSLALAEAAVDALRPLAPASGSVLGDTLSAMQERLHSRAVCDFEELAGGAEAISAFVVLTAFADALAGDGYEDPRVTS